MLLSFSSSGVSCLFYNLLKQINHTCGNLNTHALNNGHVIKKIMLFTHFIAISGGDAGSTFFPEQWEKS